MTKTSKVYLFIAGSFLVAGLSLLAAYVSLGYSLRHMDVSGFVPFFRNILPLAKIGPRRPSSCGGTWQPTNTVTNERERMMLYVETMVDQYKATFGELPEDVGDLSKLPTFSNADRLNDSGITKNCYMHVRAESYLLSCDALRPSAKELDDFLNKSERLPGFYRVGSWEVLYIPKPRCA